MKTLIKIFKKVTFSLAFLYSFNIILSSSGFNLAVNPYSVGIVTTLGFPGMISLIIVKLLLK